MVGLATPLSAALSKTIPVIRSDARERNANVIRQEWRQRPFAFGRLRYSSGCVLR